MPVDSPLTSRPREGAEALAALRKGPLTWKSLLGDWWRGQDLNLRPSGYEPDELPDCSTPRRRRDSNTGPVFVKSGSAVLR